MIERLVLTRHRSSDHQIVPYQEPHLYRIITAREKPRCDNKICLDARSSISFSVLRLLEACLLDCNESDGCHNSPGRSRPHTNRSICGDRRHDLALACCRNPARSYMIRHRRPHDDEWGDNPASPITAKSENKISWPL